MGTVVGLGFLDLDLVLFWRDGILASYVDTVRIAHMSVAPTVSEVSRGRAVAVREDGKIEPELVAVVTNSRKHDCIHPTVATSGERLPEGFSHSCTGFLLDNQLFEVEVN